MSIIQLKTKDGSTVEFVDEIKAQGGMKDVYFSPDKSYVVGFFREKQDTNSKDRLQNIVGIYRDKIFNQVGGEYWKNLFCWPEKLVEWNGKLGIVCPTYHKNFFFHGGPFDGKEKEGTWFASAKLRNRFLPVDQKGTWLDCFFICKKIACAIKFLHRENISLADFSNRNILIDPILRDICIINLVDRLIMPGNYPSEILETTDFMSQS